MSSLLTSDMTMENLLFYRQKSKDNNNFERRTLIRTVKQYFIRFLKFSRYWKIYAGLDPEGITGPALILFPCRADVLCCGLAGVLAIKEAEKPKYNDPAARLEWLFAVISRESMKKIMDGVIPSGRYLDGSDTLDALKQCISILKQGDAFERLFYDPREAAHLTALSKKMNAFLAEEQFALESRAAYF
jgi:glucosamine--fructose-6-phosphate aminotransferase (isomerizing)